MYEIVISILVFILLFLSLIFLGLSVMLFNTISEITERELKYLEENTECDS